MGAATFDPARMYERETRPDPPVIETPAGDIVLRVPEGVEALDLQGDLVDLALKPDRPQRLVLRVGTKWVVRLGDPALTESQAADAIRRYKLGPRVTHALTGLVNSEDEEDGAGDAGFPAGGQS